MQSKLLIFRVFLIASIFLLCACQPSGSTANHAPSESVLPDPLAEAWLGKWNVWVQEEVEEQPENLIINAQGMELNGDLYFNDGDHAYFTAQLNSDGSAAVGNWYSDAGKSGVVSLLLSADGDQFLGSLHGFAPMCAVREGSEMPYPCESTFEFNWAGGWQVWVGSMETEGLFYYVPGGKSIGPLSYKFIADLSDDKRSISGRWEAMASTGKIEAKLLENNVQFTGNMDGYFPFCGTRIGGEKPEPCYGP